VRLEVCVRERRGRMKMCILFFYHFSVSLVFVGRDVGSLGLFFLLLSLVCLVVSPILLLLLLLASPLPSVNVSTK